MPWFWIIVGAVAAAAVYGLHRLALWAESRGWIYYKNKRSPAGFGLGMIGQIYQPSIEHAVEEEQSTKQKADQDDSGDKPDAGSHLIIELPPER